MCHNCAIDELETYQRDFCHYSRILLSLFRPRSHVPCVHERTCGTLYRKYRNNRTTELAELTDCIERAMTGGSRKEYGNSWAFSQTYRRATEVYFRANAKLSSRTSHAVSPDVVSLVSQVLPYLISYCFAFCRLRSEV